MEAWARVTRLLPKSAWLSELQLSKDGGTLVGFSANAAALIEILENDPALKDVNFTTAIRIDPSNKAERFEVQFAHEPAQ